MPPDATPQEHRITELNHISGATFDVVEGEGGTKQLMANVRILKAGKSKNNRNYRASALKEAVEQKLFDGARMFINHDPTKPPLKRPMQEMVSAIESTSYHEQDQAIDARVEFFDEKFYTFAQRAKKYMGDSINALVRGNVVRASDGTAYEDITGIVQPRSVDWVIFPAAGGEILAFEDEGSEGVEVDWDKLTLDEVKKNAPHLVQEMEAELKPADPDPKPDDEPGDDGAKPLTRADALAIAQEAVQEYIKNDRTEASKREEAAKKVRAKMATSGLPERTRTRVMAAFEGETEYVESKVQSAIDEAKEELKAAGLAPRIQGNGPSDAKAPVVAGAYSVRESVEAHFGVKKPTTDSDDPKED